MKVEVTISESISEEGSWIHQIIQCAEDVLIISSCNHWPYWHISGVNNTLNIVENWLHNFHLRARPLPLPPLDFKKKKYNLFYNKFLFSILTLFIVQWPFMNPVWPSFTLCLHFLLLTIYMIFQSCSYRSLVSGWAVRCAFADAGNMGEADKSNKERGSRSPK